MKVAVVGLGSMGQRRTRLIKQYDSSIEVFGIDTMPERCAECQEKYGKPYAADAVCEFICGQKEAAQEEA